MGFLQASWQFLLQTLFSIWHTLTACFSTSKQDGAPDVEKQSRTSSFTSHSIEVERAPPTSPNVASPTSPPLSPKSTPPQPAAVPAAAPAPTTAPIPNPSGATWPPWPQLIYNPAAITSEENIKYLQDILAQYGDSALRTSWLTVCAELEKITARIALQQTKAIPVLDSLDAMLNASEEKKDELRAAGCFIVRAVVEKSEADGWAKEQKQYVEVNRSMVAGL